MANHGQVSFARPSAMDVAVARPHWAERRTEVSAHRIQHRLAESQAPGGIANQRRKNVTLAQGLANRHAQRLLPAAQKDAAMDFAAAIETGELVIEQAGEQHPPKRLQEFIAK